MNEGAIEIVASSFVKNERQIICVGVNEWRNELKLFIRTFVPSIDGEGFLPTKEGISLPIEKIGELLSGIRSLGDVMGGDKVVARIEKSPTQEVRVGFNLFRDIPLIYVRTFAKYGEDNEFKPTKRGISLRVEKYPELLDAVQKLEEVIQSLEED